VFVLPTAEHGLGNTRAQAKVWRRIRWYVLFCIFSG